VVVAGVGQGLLLVGDVLTTTFSGFGFLGMTLSPRTADDLPGAVFLGVYALVGLVGLGLGLAAIRGFWTGTTWARPAAIAHGAVTVFTCCPCVWPFSVWAILAATHDDVTSWPDVVARGDETLADVFR